MIKWAFANKRLFFELVLIAAVLVAGWLYRRQERKLQDAREQYATLADNLQQQITIKDGEIQVLKRKGDKVVVKKIYVPVEGPVVIQYVKPTPDNPNPDPILIVKTRGLCFRPGIGLEMGSKGLQGRLDAKWGYWGRYSGLVGGTKYGLGIGVSRHVDDVLWFKPRNTEVFVQYSILRHLDWAPIAIGIRTNF